MTVGCELAIMCDHRIVTERASFAEAWIKLGTLLVLGQTMLLSTDDFKEGLAAAKGKRAAKFTGR